MNLKIILENDLLFTTKIENMNQYKSNSPDNLTCYV